MRGGPLTEPVTPGIGTPVPLRVPFDNSRRLTGPNLFFAGCGAVMEALEVTPGAFLRWQQEVRRLRNLLGWPDAATVVREHATGASLALAAPVDQLLTATEVNEWAWQLALAKPHPKLPGPVQAVAGRDAETILLDMSARERSPGLLALLNEAQHHRVPAFWDERWFSLGAGVHGQSWPLTELPVAPDWGRYKAIPTALITGSNGKTSTVRMVAAMAQEAGLTAGFNCTDGVFVNGLCSATGDYSGPDGARKVLRDDQVQLAILETARGGLLRRGLAVTKANVATVTNISYDHLGEYGIHSLDELADAKLIVRHALTSPAISPDDPAHDAVSHNSQAHDSQAQETGVLVLNADDLTLVKKAPALRCQLAWFALNYEHPLLVTLRQKQGACCGLKSGRLLLSLAGAEYDLGAIVDMPLSVSGAARYNIANIAAAALTAALLGIAAEVIARVLARFGARRQDNPGRLERWQWQGRTVLMDYAHNPEGLAGLLAVAGALRHGQGRLALLLGQAGNRDDDAIRELARTAAMVKPDLIVFKDLEGYMRGRQLGEVPGILRDELRRCGIAEQHMLTLSSEVEAARYLIDWTQPHDVLVLPVHALSSRLAVSEYLDQLCAAASASPSVSA